MYASRKRRSFVRFLRQPKTAEDEVLEAARFERRRRRALANRHAVGKLDMKLRLLRVEDVGKSFVLHIIQMALAGLVFRPPANLLAADDELCIFRRSILHSVTSIIDLCSRSEGTC